MIVGTRGRGRFEARARKVFRSKGAVGATPTPPLTAQPGITGHDRSFRLSNRIFAESDSIRYGAAMKTLSVTEVARHFSAVLDTLERDQEEIVLVRNRRQIARLVPEAPRQDALEVFGDLFRTLDDNTAEALSAKISHARKSSRGRVSELKNPWAG